MLPSRRSISTKTIEFNVKCGRTFVPYVLQRKKGLTRENLARHKSRQMCSINSVQMIKTENPQTKKWQKMCGTLSFLCFQIFQILSKLLKKYFYHSTVFIRRWSISNRINPKHRDFRICMDSYQQPWRRASMGGNASRTRGKIPLWALVGRELR